MRGVAALTAYRRSSGHRSPRQQEADIFLRVNAMLRGAHHACGLSQAAAMADNDRLWITVMDLVRDPRNELPESLRASILSVGHSVRREMARIDPDIGFLITINEHIAAGLSGIPNRPGSVGV